MRGRNAESGNGRRFVRAMKRRPCACRSQGKRARSIGATSLRHEHGGCPACRRSRSRSRISRAWLPPAAARRSSRALRRAQSAVPHEPFQPHVARCIDEQDDVNVALEAGLEQQRNVAHHHAAPPSTARRRGARRGAPSRPDARWRRAHGAPPRPRTPRVAGRPGRASHRSRACRVPIAPRSHGAPAIPAATASRARTSASITGTPRASSIRATADFPLPMFPVSPTTSIAAVPCALAHQGSDVTFASCVGKVPSSAASSNPRPDFP